MHRDDEAWMVLKGAHGGWWDDSGRGRQRPDRGGSGWGWRVYTVDWAFLGHLGTTMRGTDATEISPNSQA